jgi:signal transduction histidine kinase
MKFTEHGSVTVSARCFDEYIEIAVKDTGIGIEKEKLPVIFDMFRQVDSSKTRSHGGVGVGLFIVKKYVELLNGKIEVQSIPGRGTVFTLRIPVDDFAQPPKLRSEDLLARLMA